MTTKKNILITGGSGLLAINWAVSQRNNYSITLSLHRRKIVLSGVNCFQLSLESVDSILEFLNVNQPDLLIHTAGLTNIEMCEAEPDLARYINVELSKNITDACASLGIKLVHISTDHLFSGEVALVSENNQLRPQNIYATTKAEAEKYVFDNCPDALIIRTNFFGWGLKYRESFSDMIINSLSNNKSIMLFQDVFYTPILIETLSGIVHELDESGTKGIYHVVCNERLSKLEFGYKIAERFGLNSKLIISGSIKQNSGLVKRPMDMSLSNVKLCDFLDREIGSVESQLNILHHQQQKGITRELREI